MDIEVDLWRVHFLHPFNGDHSCIIYDFQFPKLIEAVSPAIHGSAAAI